MVGLIYHPFGVWQIFGALCYNLYIPSGLKKLPSKQMLENPEGMTRLKKTALKAFV
jgi:hypothetical protein